MDEYNTFELGEFNPLFERISDENNHLKAEEIGFKRHPDFKVYVKAEYYDTFCSVWQKERNVSKFNSIHSPNVMRQVLGLKEIDRFYWEVSVKKLEEKIYG